MSQATVERREEKKTAANVADIVFSKGVLSFFSFLLFLLQRDQQVLHCCEGEKSGCVALFFFFLLTLSSSANLGRWRTHTL